MNHPPRKLLRRRDLLLLLPLLISVGLLMCHRPQGNTGVITAKGQEIARLNLAADGSYTFDAAGPMVFQISGGKIQVLDSDCGDKTCVRTGSISSPGEAIVCLPHQVTVTVLGQEEPELDLILP